MSSGSSAISASGSTVMPLSGSLRQPSQSARWTPAEPTAIVRAAPATTAVAMLQSSGSMPSMARKPCRMAVPSVPLNWCGCEMGQLPEAEVAVPSWMAEAACQGMPTAKFFEGRTDRAVTVCVDCPVMVRCLDYALEHRLRDGIFGGMTPGERQAEARRRRDDERAA